MIGFRTRFEIPPDPPGAPKIFLPRIVFLLPGILLLCGGLWEAWQYFQLPPAANVGSHGSGFTLNLMEMHLEPRFVAGTCALVFLLAGAFFLWLALMAERSLRRSPQGDHDNDPSFVSARKFSVAAGLVGYLCVFGIFISPWLNNFVPGIVVGFIWVSTAGALCVAILRFFAGKGRAPVQNTGDDLANRDSVEPRK